MLEISKKKEDNVIREMIIWVGDDDPNIRRVASEGLRGVARRNPEKVLPVIERLKTDDSLYVKKSVVALLRAISKKNPALAYVLSQSCHFCQILKKNLIGR